ncbi:MAG: ABC transporter substrate-binding protein [Paraglaciecola sp.]|nr:ABC transporter substrate-binding protein [Paraglaciecola sp.]
MKRILFIFAIMHTYSVYCIEVAFINPTKDDSPFWQRVNQVAISAANDLNIQLKIYNSGGHRLFQKQVINQIIKQETKPDYIIFLPFDGTVQDTFTKLEQANIPFITIEKTVFTDVNLDLGHPGGKFKFWLGAIYHDNKKAGQLLANSLFKASNNNQPITDSFNVLGITGDFSGQSSDRNAGLITELEQQSRNFALAQIVNAHWERKLAADKFNGLLKRYSNISIVWAAADIMALGVVDIAEQQGKIINKDLFVGGFDWAIEALQAIKENRYTASVGGHFMQTAWALVKIYDHNNDKPVFINGSKSPSFELQLIDRNNIDNYQVLLNKPDWSKVDFRQFTLSHQADIADYQFDFSRVLKKLNQ